jgi:hypothetical protein
MRWRREKYPCPSQKSSPGRPAPNLAGTVNELSRQMCVWGGRGPGILIPFPTSQVSSYEWAAPSHSQKGRLGLYGWGMRFMRQWPRKPPRTSHISFCSELTFFWPQLLKTNIDTLPHILTAYREVLFDRYVTYCSFSCDFHTCCQPLSLSNHESTYTSVSNVIITSVV